MTDPTDTERRGTMSDRVNVSVSHSLPHDAPTAIPAEGARVGLTTCRVCGAALLLDPREDVSPLDVHYLWHRWKREVI